MNFLVQVQNFLHSGDHKNAFDQLGKFNDVIAFLTFIGSCIIFLLGYFARMLHIYLTRTTVSVLATKVEIPDEISIKQALGFHKEINRVRFVQNLDLPNHQDYEARIADFYHCNQSKISDLQENKHISLFLLAHQSIIAKLGYDLQDQKTVKLYHKLRDTYGNAWGWENFWTYKSFFRFLWINYLKNWYLYIRGWNYTISAPNSLDYTKDVILKIQTSFPITSTIDGVDNANSYTMNLEKGGSIGNKHFLRRTSQIKEFEAEFKKYFNLIDGNMTNGVKVHLIMNVPAPFAFVIGSSIHSSSRSVVVLYEERNGKYLETFTLNKP